LAQPLNIKISKKIFNKAYLPHLEQYDTRFNVFYGGAGSGKSHFVIQKMILKYLKYPNRKCLVIRKVGNTLRDSVFALFKSVLADWQIYDKCDVRETLLTIDLPNGSQFIFKGLDDEEKIKSIANIDDIIVEECTELTLDEFSQLNLRLRSKNLYNQIHCMFNPVSKSNWVYRMWFEEGFNEKTTIIVHTTFKDNKFLPQDYIDALLEMEKTNPTKFKIYALGEFATLDKLIFNNWKEECFDYRDILKENKNITAVFGMDFGYTNDPTAFVCVLIDRVDKKLYIYDEFQQKGLTNDEIAKKIIEMGYQKEIIICDSAEPKSIEELQRNGLTRVKAATKGKDSILNGIQYLQQFEIVIHPDCTHIIEEFKNYTWQKDRDGIYINKPIDRYNHGMDALRYATDAMNIVGKLKLFDRKLLGL
jgi:phage terminase large subunit